MTFALILFVVAVVWRERPLVLEAVPHPVVAAMSGIGGEGVVNWESIRFTSREDFSTQGRTFEARIETVLRPLGGGWVSRSDEWCDPKGSSSLRQSRSLSFRNLATALYATRELAPFVHDLLGSAGWYYDRTMSVKVERDSGFPITAGATLKVRREQLADSPGDSRELRPTRYFRELQCRVETSASPSVQLGTSVEPASAVSCRTEYEGGRRSTSYLFLRRIGIYLLVGADEEGREARARWSLDKSSFEVR